MLDFFIPHPHVHPILNLSIYLLNIFPIGPSPFLFPLPSGLHWLSARFQKSYDLSEMEIFSCRQHIHLIKASFKDSDHPMVASTRGGILQYSLLSTSLTTSQPMFFPLWEMCFVPSLCLTFSYVFFWALSLHSQNPLEKKTLQVILNWIWYLFLT